MKEVMDDMLEIRRVANGWIMSPAGRENEFTHVASLPKDLADHVLKWAQAQIEPFTVKARP